MSSNKRSRLHLFSADDLNEEGFTVDCVDAKTTLSSPNDFELNAPKFSLQGQADNTHNIADLGLFLKTLNDSVGSGLQFAIQGCLVQADPTSTYTVPIGSLVDGSSFGTYENLALTTFDPNGMLSGNVVTIPTTGWWRIYVYLFHPPNTIDGVGAQEGLGNSSLRLVWNGNTSSPDYVSTVDENAGSNECFASTITYYLQANSNFYLQLVGTAQTNEDFIVRISCEKIG